MESATAELTVTTRARRYGIGHDELGFAVVDLAAPGSPPVDRFPPGRAGWNLAWQRLQVLEGHRGRTGAPAPGPGAVRAGDLGGPAVAAGLAAAEVRGRPTALDVVDLAAAAGAAAGVALGVAGLFPAYLGGVSLASRVDGLWTHVVYLATFAAASALLAGGGRVARAGAALGSGLAAVTLGLFLADIGTDPGHPAGATGAGMVLSVAGWLVCAVSFAVALASHERAARSVGAPATRPSRLGPRRALPVPLASAGLVVAILAAALFAPPWDRYVVTALAGTSEVLTAGNVFSGPGLAVAGDVLAMVAVVAVAAYAVLRARDLTAVGAGLLAGSALALVAQIVSALAEPAPGPAAFGIGGAAAARAGVTITAGFTAWFYLYCAAVAALVLIATGVALARRATTGGHAP